MKEDYSVVLNEEFRKEKYGPNETDPIDTVYLSHNGKGLLTFGSRNLSKAPLFEDVRVFHLLFYGNNESDDERESWADPIRVEVLRRLQIPEWHWYLSFVGDIPDNSSETGFKSIESDVEKKFLQKNKINAISVRSEELFRETGPRLYLEVPDEYIYDIVSNYWHTSWPGYTIQGYLLPSSRIDILKDWDQNTRDQFLFRRVIDESYLVFYTFPAENRHFVFLSNKITLDELEVKIGLEKLQKMAREIGNKVSKE